MPACTNWRSGALRSLYISTDFTLQQGKRHNMGGSIPALCKSPGTGGTDTISIWSFKRKLFSPKYEQRLEIDSRLLQICANQRPQNKMVLALLGTHTPVLCMLGKGCCWKKVRHAVMLTYLSGLLGPFRVLVIGLHPTVPWGQLCFHLGHLPLCTAMFFLLDTLLWTTMNKSDLWNKEFTWVNGSRVLTFHLVGTA